MKSKLKNIPLFFVVLAYLASRLILISPDAIEKKSKRLIFFHQQYVSLVNESKNRIGFSIFAKRQLAGVPGRQKIYPKTFHSAVFNRHLSVVSYKGTRVHARPDEPDDHV